MRLLVLGTRQNPSRPAQTALRIEGLEDSPQRSEIQKACASDGIKVLEDDRIVRDAVKVELVSIGGDSQLAWRGSIPKLDSDQLQDPVRLASLRRRDEIQRRRQLLSGLQSLFKHAHARSYRYGEGFWLAPHLWFVLGMSRDSAGPSGVEADGAWIEIIGPPYHRVFSRAVRQHWHEVMQATEIGLIFVADGVRFSSLKRTLRVILEVYDIHRGKRRLEERDLVGIPGVRCIVHDLDLESPFTNRHYPEPDYEDVARARVLHIYRDRGGEDELADVSTLFDLEPTALPDGVNVFQ
jgi:hypothetical protein